MPNNAVNSLTSGSPAVSIVVPVYRSAQILPTLVEETRQAIQSLGLENRFEIVFVNDASPATAGRPSARSPPNTHSCVACGCAKMSASTTR